jgi:hypothetical protein
VILRLLPLRGEAAPFAPNYLQFIKRRMRRAAPENRGTKMRHATLVVLGYASWLEHILKKTATIELGGER